MKYCSNVEDFTTLDINWGYKWAEFIHIQSIHVHRNGDEDLNRYKKWNIGSQVWKVSFLQEAVPQNHQKAHLLKGGLKHHFTPIIGCIHWDFTFFNLHNIYEGNYCLFTETQQSYTNLLRHMTSVTWWWGGASQPLTLITRYPIKYAPWACYSQDSRNGFSKRREGKEGMEKHMDAYRALPIAGKRFFILYNQHFSPLDRT